MDLCIVGVFIGGWREGVGIIVKVVVVVGVDGVFLEFYIDLDKVLCDGLSCLLFDVVWFLLIDLKVIYVIVN